MHDGNIHPNGLTRAQKKLMQSLASDAATPDEQARDLKNCLAESLLFPYVREVLNNKQPDIFFIENLKQDISYDNQTDDDRLFLKCLQSVAHKPHSVESVMRHILEDRLDIIYRNIEQRCPYENHDLSIKYMKRLGETKKKLDMNDLVHQLMINGSIKSERPSRNLNLDEPIWGAAHV